MSDERIILPGDPEFFQAAARPNVLSHSDQQKLEAALRDGWRLTPATMAQKITRGWWIPARHLLHISTIVATELAKGGARIIVTMPFRHGKSEFLSVNTPIWFLEKWPHKYVMNLTYGVELATDFSIRVRDTFRDEELHDLLRTRISFKKMRAERFLTTSGGGLTAAGIGGPIVGRGADLMCIDDYIKNAEEAMSEAHHKKTWEWFRGVAYTRLEPDASLIVLATRWGQNDLIGRLITEMPEENWIVINLPMHAMINDPLGREPGEVLWPERYNEEACERIKRALGPFWYQAQCQGDPPASMSGADVGDKIKIIKEDALPEREHLKTLRIWDLAATEGGGDYTAGPKVSRDRKTGKIYIENLIHKQQSPGQNKTRVAETAMVDGHGVEIWMEQEPGSAGKTVIEDYKQLLKAYVFEGEKATGPAEVRASPLIAAIEAGNVYMIEAEWNGAVRLELNAFPDGVNDDIVIALALGYNKLVLGLSGGVVWGRKAFDQKNVTHVDFKDGRRIPQPRRKRRAVTQQEIHDTPIRRLTW